MSAKKERAQELRAEARATKRRADGERDVLAKIAEMQRSDRATSRNGTTTYRAMPKYMVIARIGQASPMRIAIAYAAKVGSRFLLSVLKSWSRLSVE